VNCAPSRLDGTAFAGRLARGIDGGPYTREIFRAGIDSIDKGQMEAAKSLGMPNGLAMRRIILPQAARVIVPPLGNEFNNMIKTTSLVAFIGVTELFQNAEIGLSQTFKPVEYFLSVGDVRKRFGRLEVLKGVSLDVAKRETVCVIGPSGSGKSTFLRCINHLEKIDDGRIEVNGHLIGYRERSGKLVEDSDKNIAKQRCEVGMVFQRFNLFPHKTALRSEERRVGKEGRAR